MSDHTNTTTATPAPTTGQGQMAADDPRLAMAGAVRTARAVMGAVAPDQWDLPTPCSEMMVRDLLEHLVMVNRRIALAGRSVPVAEWPSDAADVADGDWLEAFTEAAHDIQASWPDEGLSELRQVPWGAFTGEQVLEVYASELTVHTWDLARATGQEPDWDPQVVQTSWDAMQFQLPVADRTAMWEQARQHLPAGVPWEDPFANAVEISDDAPLIDRLAAWNGRTP
jgi:uncharacterized protein (TIGR03086 family)